MWQSSERRARLCDTNRDRGVFLSGSDRGRRCRDHALLHFAQRLAAGHAEGGRVLGPPALEEVGVLVAQLLAGQSVEVALVEFGEASVWSHLDAMGGGDRCSGIEGT